MKLLAVLIVLLSVMSFISSATIDSNRERRARPKVTEKLENDNEQEESRLTDKIIGGSNAGYGNIPWQARVVVYGNDTHQCGATIIDEYWLLSAAHCFDDGQEYDVIVGDYDSREREVGEQKFAVEFFKHKMYNDTSHDSDIALLRIVPINGRGIQFSKYAKPACLPTRATPFIVGQKCLISGWGYYQIGKRLLSPILQSAVVKLIGQQQCTEMYPRMYPRITKNMLCAGYIAGGIDACNNDSGGPLVIKTRDCPILVGIVSWGVGCALPNYPGVYVRVSEFLPWIYSTMKALSFDSDRTIFQENSKRDHY